MIVSLDVAKSMGVVYYRDGQFFCTTYTGTPVEQFEMLASVLGEEIGSAKFIIEQLNSFQNAHTTREILHRVGYLKNSLLREGAEVKFVNVMKARKYLGAKNKSEVAAMFKPFGLNGDEADALAILMFAQDIPFVLLEKEQVHVLRELKNGIEDYGIATV